MSFTKKTIQELIQATSLIQTRTLDDNNLSEILEGLSTMFEIAENISKTDTITNYYWNEILSELIAVIYSSLSGYNRLGITGLRNILELLCHAFYYYDHRIELNLSINENAKADKYVSSLITDHLFFTTKYIKTFFLDIENIEQKTDCVSIFLKSEYSTLCDVVHGRHKTLTKINNLKINYNKIEFKKFENHLLNLYSIASTMYILRYNDFSNTSIIKFAKKTNLIKI